VFKQVAGVNKQNIHVRFDIPSAAPSLESLGYLHVVPVCKYILRRILMREGNQQLFLQDDKNLASWALRKLFGVPG